MDGRRNVAERLRGAFGFPAQYGHEPAGIWKTNKPRSGFNLDIVGGAVASLCEAYREIVRFDGEGHWVNMLFDCETEDIEIQSPYTHPRLGVRVKRPGPLHVRLPPWVDSNAALQNGYLVIGEPEVGEWISFDLELPVHEMTLTWRDTQTRARLRGDEVVAMDNFDTDLTFFEPFD